MSNKAIVTEKAPAAVGPYSAAIQAGNCIHVSGPVSYTHLTLPTTAAVCRSRWSPYH